MTRVRGWGLNRTNSHWVLFERSNNENTSKWPLSWHEKFTNFIFSLDIENPINIKNLGGGNGPTLPHIIFLLPNSTPRPPFFRKLILQWYHWRYFWLRVTESLLPKVLVKGVYWLIKKKKFQWDIKALGTVWSRLCNFLFSSPHWFFPSNWLFSWWQNGASNCSLRSVFNTIQCKKSLLCSKIPEVLLIILMGWAYLSHGPGWTQSVNLEMGLIN